MNTHDSSLTILHTNDIHGHLKSWQGWDAELKGQSMGGFDRLASVVQEARKEKGADHVLLLDAGDAIGDTEVAAETQGQAVLSLMKDLGYDAMTLGNHEYDFGPEKLRNHARELPFPVLAANLTEKNGSSHPFKAYVVLERGNLRIGIIGLTYPNTPLTTSPKNVEPFQFLHDSGPVEKSVQELRSQKVDLVIVLSHLGLGADIQLAQSVSGIDLIIGGHSHNRMTKPTEVNGVQIVQAGAHGSDVGRLDLSFKAHQLQKVDYHLVTLNEKIPRDPAFVDRVEKSFDKPARSAQSSSADPSSKDPVLGEATEIIARAQTLAGSEPRKRDKQSDADSLIADLIREATGAQVALLPGVGYGVALQKGAVKKSDLKNLIPHDSKLVTFKMSGQQIRQILEQSVENVLTKDPKAKVGGIIQVSGISFSYKPQASFGKRIEKIHLGDQDLDLHKSYLVVTNELLASGGHAYATFKSAQKISSSEDSQFEIVRKSIQRKGKISPPKDQRIQEL